MRMPPLPPRRPPLELPRGERLLAWAELLATPDQEQVGGPVVAAAVGGSREALYLPGRVAWEEVASADWDADAGVLRVVEVGRFGQERTVHTVRLADAARLLQLVRERVTASIVVRRHVPIVGDAGVRIVARRPPHGAAAPAWFVEYDEAIDPDDPTVRAEVERALARVRGEVEPG